MTNQIALFSYSVNALDAELKTLRPKVMLLNKKCYSGLWLHHTAHYTEKMLYTHLWTGSVSKERVGHRRLGCKKAMVGTGWANPRPGCMNGLRKYYFHLVCGSFLVGDMSWLLNECC